MTVQSRIYDGTLMMMNRTQHLSLASVYVIYRKRIVQHTYKWLSDKTANGTEQFGTHLGGRQC